MINNNQSYYWMTAAVVVVVVAAAAACGAVLVGGGMVEARTTAKNKSATKTDGDVNGVAAAAVSADTVASATAAMKEDSSKDEEEKTTSTATKKKKCETTNNKNYEDNGALMMDDALATPADVASTNHNDTFVPVAEQQDKNASIEDDDSYYESDYEYEDDDAPHEVQTKAPCFITSKHVVSSYNKEQAIFMSLRADKETHSGKRRLAHDLYRIMMMLATNDSTEEAGFSIAPTEEDHMEVWTIQLFQFDPDSHLHKDMIVLNLESIELEMTFPDDYPFAPPFVRVVRPRFRGGFILSGAICMELLTAEGWNPVNDIETVIVSIRSHICMGKGRLESALEMTQAAYDEALARKQTERESNRKVSTMMTPPIGGSSYTKQQAQSSFAKIAAFHKEKGWSNHWLKEG